MNYKIDYSDWFDEGGYCQFYPIKDHISLGFKEFYSKRDAQKAYSIQQKLSKFDLAPKIYSNVCKLEMVDDQDQDFINISDWGYVTEIARTQDKLPLKYIQKLVNDIYKKTNLKFWDCHYHNMGWIKRGRSKKLVCIDTGKESFNGFANAWGNSDPGPKCGYCKKYNCKCEE
jgi:hypothetical protein